MTTPQSPAAGHSSSASPHSATSSLHEAPLQCPALACGGSLIPERAHGITVNRCDRCGGVWFDAEELDRRLADYYKDPAGPPEHRMPGRGPDGHPCPRCHTPMDTAGWTDLVMDRCPMCHGLFVRAPKLRQLEHEPAPARAMSDAHRFEELMVAAGWDVLIAEAFADLLIMFYR